jgi:RelA/SpoT family (p)ppGpp synthetase
MNSKDFNLFLSQLKTEAVKLVLSEKDKNFLSEAYDFGEKKHTGQTRAIGEPYFQNHCVPVAIKIASLGFNVEMIAAGLLHDTIEDTETTYEEIENRFGAKVASLVEGVSKLGKVKYQGNERHVESLRKFFLAIAQDVDVIVIKLCDRWHNLETLHYLPPEKQQRIARESIIIYAQLASRLGIGSLVSTLSDLAFPYAYPEEYKKTRDLMENKLRDEDEIIKKMYRNLLSFTTSLLGYKPKIDKRRKGIYSLYKKLDRKDWNINEIYDLIAFRIIVHKPQDCYAVLGAVHSKWRPVPGRLKDYIALPKPNGYKSLHTAVFSGSGPIVEIQIRTGEMHYQNEYGIASHGIYKLSQERVLTPQTKSWLTELGSFQNFEDRDQYIDNLTTGFFSDRIFVLTPAGDVIDMPQGATVLDFAYLVHSDIGDQAIGGRVDGKYVALKTKLASEQIVDIVTSPRSKPTAHWLDWVVTSHARSKIRRCL